MERDYLWGPGDGITSGAGGGLDELIGIFDIDRRAWWTLLDASGDVVAVVDDSGSTLHGYGTGVGGVSSPARLCGQFGYDAYGQLIAVQSLHPFPDPRTGHKGLHLDRLDAGVADPLTGAAITRHEVGATHAYFVRNRHYSPELGRFMQRDPNATECVPSSLAMHGVGHRSGVAAAMLVQHISDGVGVYGYLGQSPFAYVDPAGLWISLGFQMATLAVDMELSVESTFEDAYDGVRTFLLLDQLIDNYAWDQASDVKWATDWSDRDDAYSKSVTMDYEQSYGINTNFDGGTPTFVMGVRGKGPGGLSPGQVRNRVKGLRPSRQQVGGHMSIPGREGVRVYVARSPAEAARKIRMGREQDVYVRNQQDAEAVIAGLPQMQKVVRFRKGLESKRHQYEYHGPDMGAIDMHHIKYRSQRDDGTDVDGHIFWGSAFESKP